MRGKDMTTVPLGFFQKWLMIFSIPFWLIYEMLPKTKEEKERERQIFMKEMREYRLSQSREEDGWIWAGRR
jgi:hypothetical protein